MSKFVDERVVEMSFDNKRFESNVKTSMGTINELKNSLDFSGTANSLNNQLNHVDTGGLSGAIMNAKHSFTLFEIAAIASIANITNRIIDMGIQMVKSLSTDQIGAGWDKFGQSAISEATLLAQGFNQEEVSAVLEKLLWYTDETSYSFTDMLDNMSKFTATGQDLDDAAKAMMGIANWAALSGQNAGVASRAMYQLSQAMAQGNVRLMDYKSIQNANMDTKEFRETVLETAVAMGTLIQNIDGSYTTLTGKTFNIGQFTTELSELWFTSEVLMSSLDKYSSGSEKLYEKIAEDDSINTASEAIAKYGDDLDEFELKAFLAAQEARTFKDAVVAIKDAVASGWMNVFTQIFGRVAEAKILWTGFANELYNVFMDGMWTKIDVLSIWAENNGRDDLFANTEENTGAFWNLFRAIVAIKDLIGGSWQKVFGFSDLEDYDERVEDIATKLKTFTENLKEWSEGLIMSSETTEVLTNILTGLFSILKLVGKTIIAVWQGFEPLLEVMKPLIGYILWALGLVGKEITDFTETTTVFEKITQNLQKFFTAIIDFVKSLELLKNVKILVDAFGSSLQKVLGDTDANTVAVSGFRSVIDSLSRAFQWLGDVFTKYILPVLPRAFELLGTGVGWLVGTIINLITNIGDLIKRFREWVKANQTIQNGLGKLKTVLVIIGDTFKRLMVNIKGFFASFGSVNMKPVDKFTGDVETKFSPLKAFIEGLSNLFQGLWHVVKAILPVVGAFFSFIGKALTTIGDKLKAIFTTGDGETDFSKIFTVGFWALVLVGVYRFADMLRSITQVFRDSFDSMFDFFNSKAMMQYMEAIKTMAISILLMVGALLILGSMDTAVLTKSMIALGVLVGFIVGVMILMKSLIKGMSITSKSGFFGAKETISTTANIAQLGIAFIGLGLAILLLATSLKMISKMNPKEMMYSLVILGLLMGMIVTVMKVVGKTEKGVNKAVKSMVKVAVSVALLARPLKIIGSIDIETGIKGLIGIAALMAILTLYSQFSKSIDQSQRPIHGMLSTAFALILLIIPLKVIGAMDWGSLGKSFAAIAALFAILVIVSKVMNEGDAHKLKEISWILAKVGVGLAAFGIAMLIMGLVSWGAIAKSLLSLVVVFGLLVAMNKILDKQLTKPRVENLNNMMKALRKLAFGLALFGIAMLIVGMNSPGAIIKSLLSLIVVFGLLVAMNKVLDKQLTKPRIKNMSKTIWSLSALSIGLTAFGIAMRTIGNIPWLKILKSLATIAIVFVMLGAFDKVLKSTGSSWYTMIAMGGALMILAAGLLVLSVALLALGSMRLVTLAKGLGAVALVFVLLAAAAKVLSPVILTLLALSATFILFAVGVFLLVSAFSALVAMMTISAAVFAAGLIAMSTAVVVAAPMIMQALWAIVEGILEMVTNAIPLVIEVLTTLILEILNAIDTIIPPLLATITNLLFNILDSINIVIPKIIETLLTLLEQLLGAIVEIFPTVTSTLMTLLFELLDTLITNIPELVNKLVDLFIGLISTLGERLPEIMMEMALFLTNFVNGAVAALIELIPNMASAGFDLIIGVMDGIGDALVENAPLLREAMIKLATDMITAFASFFGVDSDFIKNGEEIIINIGKGIKSKTTDVIIAVQEFAGNIRRVFSDGWESFKTTGKDVIAKILEGLKSAWTATETWFKNRIDDIKGFFDDAWNSFKQIGKDIIGGIIQGLKDVWNNLKKEIEDLANALPKWMRDILGIKSPSTIFSDIGKNIVQGIISGITGLWDDIKKEVEKLASALPNWMKKILGINSPSKVFAEIGEFIDLGLSKGITDNSGEVYDSVSGLADEAIDGAKDSGLSKVLSELGNSLNSDFDNEVVIRPVMDLSEIQNGKNLLYSMMNDMGTYDISGSNSIAGRTRDDINSGSRRSGDDSKNGSKQGNTISEVVHNTFNIKGSNPKEIADEISRALQNQVDRRKAKWAL